MQSIAERSFVGNNATRLHSLAVRQLSVPFVLVPKKLLNESLWIRKSNQMTAPNYVYIGFQTCTGNAPLKFQREETIVCRSDDTHWYRGPAAKLAGLSENDFRFVALTGWC